MKAPESRASIPFIQLFTSLPLPLFFLCSRFIKYICCSWWVHMQSFNEIISHIEWCSFWSSIPLHSVTHPFIHIKYLKDWEDTFGELATENAIKCNTGRSKDVATVVHNSINGWGDAQGGSRIISGYHSFLKLGNIEWLTLPSWASK